jgi:hypothetical protein
MQAPVAMPQQQQHRISLLERIASASAAFGDLTKDSKNDYLKSSYLALPGLLKAVKQPLLEAGVAIYTQVLVGAVGGYVVQTTLSTVDGSEEIASSFPIVDVSNLHKIGAAVTYGTRYNLLALLAICPDNDDDGSSAVYGSNSAPPASLPGLPGGAASWPAPGQQVQQPPHMMQQPVYQQPMMQQPQYQQPMMPAQAVVNPAQPLPVLS